MELWKRGNGECKANYEFLLYLLKEMQGDMKTVEQLKQEVAQTRLPQGTKDLFYRVLDTADVESLSENERMRYESDLKNYMDTMSCIEFATITGKEEGRAEGLAEGLSQGKAEGLAEGKISIAKSMKAKGLDITLIAECTGLTVGEIEKL